MKILIVDDSMLVRSMLISLLESIGGYEIIGQASNGKAAIEDVKRLKPDLLIMDINMPIMDGITATGIIMKETPLPIIIFTSEDIASVGFNALNHGALEVIPKPHIGQINNSKFAAEFDSILKHACK
ncbi:MAG: response regulator, partial [Spirochaetaceae bacterium]|nr:response regulator [Spirochaetaceae bacterium]